MKQQIIKPILVIAIVIIGILVIGIFGEKFKPKTIPTGIEFSGISDLSEQLNVPQDIFEAYLTAINSDYDAYVKNLNETGLTPAEIVANTKSETGYDFADYIQTMTFLNNKTPPDENKYAKIETGVTLSANTSGELVTAESSIEVFISKTSLENLKKADIKAVPIIQNRDNSDSETAKIFSLFALLPYTDGDIATFVNGANEAFDCNSVELSNVNLYAGYGIKEPENDNQMAKDLFHVKAETGELYKAVSMPVITLKYDDEAKNRSFGIINLAGIIFVSDNIKDLQKLDDTNFLDMQIRQASTEK